jgi:hypothetical protein
MTELKRLEKQYADAVKDSAKWAERRRSLPPGSTRARVTTANARWAQAAEHRDRLQEELAAMRAKTGGG